MAPLTFPLDARQQTIILSRFGGKYGFKRYCEKQEHFKSGTCPFCVGNGFNPEKNEVIYRNEHFMVWVTPRSYNRKSDTLDLYALIVPYDHINTMYGQPDECRAAVFDADDWVCDYFNIPGGMLGARTGDVAYSAATEEHLHFFRKVPNLYGLKKKDVREPIAKTDGDVMENLLRGARFAILSEKLGVTPEHFAKLVEDGLFDTDGHQIKSD